MFNLACFTFSIYNIISYAASKGRHARITLRTTVLNVIKPTVCFLSDGYPDPDYLKTVKKLLKDSH